jgi:hypothetical protein
VRTKSHPDATGGSWIRRTVVALLAIAAFVAPAVVLAAPASAATCYGDYCSGTDPQATGCSNGAYDLASTPIAGNGGLIELRWSPSCKTEWARVPASWGNAYPNQLDAVQPSTGYKQVGVVSGNGTYDWTRQIYSPTRCVYAGWVGPPGTTSTACV